jgi:hypothetical protein
MKTTLLLLSFSFILSGCTPKTQTVFEDKLVCVEQQTIPRIEPIKIRIHNDDVQIALEYKAINDMNFQFYEDQVLRNNNLCKEK